MTDDASSPQHEHWLKITLTDSLGAWDIGNIGVFVLLGMVFSTVTYILGMATLAAFFPNINFDGDMAESIGFAVGAICGGFATALSALGVYRWGDARRPYDRDRYGGYGRDWDDDSWGDRSDYGRHRRPNRPRRRDDEDEGAELEEKT